MFLFERALVGRLTCSYLSVLWEKVMLFRVLSDNAGLSFDFVGRTNDKFLHIQLGSSLSPKGIKIRLVQRIGSYYRVILCFMLNSSHFEVNYNVFIECIFDNKDFVGITKVITDEILSWVETEIYAKVDKSILARLAIMGYS